MITKNQFIVLIISFIVALFITHPIDFNCDKSCMTAVVFLSCAFAFLNMEIYAFFTGASVWNPFAWGASTESLFDNNSQNNKIIRKIAFGFIVINDMAITYGIYQQSWIFN